MAAASRILVADDEPNLRRVLAAILTRDGYEVVAVSDGAEALERLDDTIDVVITDLKMPKASGMEVLEHVSAAQMRAPVIMITAFGTVDSAVTAVKAGAFDYIEKPFEQEQIRQIVDKAARQSQKNAETPRVRLSKDDEAAGRFGLVGDSPEMRSIYDVIQTVADTPSTALISGESGTGKELVAKALHSHSSRRDHPFIKINCAAIPKDLMEPELFGHEKGAFTGAVSSKPGRFELADGGTLFLDEIGEIPVEMQVKLLRAIQESEFERVGGIKTLRVDVRLITATNRDLEREVGAGNFREDLYYRLNVVPLRIPPLRERLSDLPLLASHILAKFNARLGRRVVEIAPDAMRALCEHAWPGNIRELENVLERTMLFSTTEIIELADLPTEIRGESEEPLAAAAEPAGEPRGVSGAHSLKEIVRAETSRVERELIVKALDETGGNVTQAARRLKISRKSLQMKMKEFGLRDREAGL